MGNGISLIFGERTYPPGDATGWEDVPNQRNNPRTSFQSVGRHPTAQQMGSPVTRTGRSFRNGYSFQSLSLGRHPNALAAHSRIDLGTAKALTKEHTA